MAFTELRSDAEYHMFGEQHPHAVKMVLAHWCGACERFRAEKLQGVLNQLQVMGVPVGIAEWKNLSPHLQKDTSLFQSWPAIVYYRNGEPQKPQYLGDRTPSVLADWLGKRMAEA